MREGDRLGERYRLTASLSVRDGVERWRAVAVDTGEPVELLLLPPGVDGAARAQFVELHERLARVADPSLARSFEVRTTAEGTWAVRAPLEVPTLDRLKRPVDSATAAWIGSALAPAVLTAGPATRGALRAADVGIDPHGRPVLAPRIEPLTRVALGSTRSVAPEAFAGAASDGAAGLFGLGVLLYELVTGREPVGSGPPTHRGPPAPPSSVRHGIPPEFDRAVLRLMSTDPGQRVGAVPLLQALAGPPVDLRSLVLDRSPTTTEVRVGRADGGRRASLPDPGGLVVLGASAASKLEPAQRSHLAGLARLSLATLDDLVARRLPIVVEATPGASSARGRAAELARTSGLPLGASVPGSVRPILYGAAGFLASLVPLVFGVALLLLGLLPLGIGAFVVAAIVAAAGPLAARVGAGVPFTDGLAAWVRTREARAELGADGSLAPAWERLASVRLELATSDLPPAAGSDLRDALKEIEGQLESLARVSRTAENTLRQVDLPALRARLVTLSARAADDATLRAERDRLTRTVADLEAVQAQAEGLSAENGRLVDALAEISSALGQVRSDLSEEGLVRLGAAARRIRSVEPGSLGLQDRELEAARRRQAARAAEGG